LPLKLEFTAILERGDKYLIASCPELPEANGQGKTRSAALRDLAASIQSVLEYRRQEAFSQSSPEAERTTVTVG
jgi:predicted RNase H-like HicB family nuclease